MKPLEAKNALQYLGRTATYNNSEWVVLYINMGKSQRIWGTVATVLGEMGALIKAREMVCWSIAPAMLMYGSKI